MAVYDDGFGPHSGASRANSIVNYAGAALSLALMVGVGVWGYQLVMRDVSGIPVVRAMEGDMRVLPDNPGGDVALHTGLSVNEVAAMGEAGGPEDRLVLAPATTGLAREDLTVPPAPVAQDATPATPVEPPLDAAADDVTDNAAILALADQITAGIAPLETAPAIDVIPSSVPGVTLSPRPVVRPDGLQPVAPDQVQANTNEVAVTTTTFAAGTNLVQLGAFPTPTLAATEWTRLAEQFDQLMDNKSRVIQVSNQSSGTWYRLRASGFDDRAAARRFCAALEAEGANCIAVMVN